MDRRFLDTTWGHPYRQLLVDHLSAQGEVEQRRRAFWERTATSPGGPAGLPEPVDAVPDDASRVSRNGQRRGAPGKPQGAPGEFVARPRRHGRSIPAWAIPIVVVLLLAAGAAAGYVVEGARVHGTQVQLAAVSGRLAAANRSAVTLRSELSDLQDRSSAQSTQLARVNAQAKASAAQVKALKAALASALASCPQASNALDQLPSLSAQLESDLTVATGAIGAGNATGGASDVSLAAGVLSQMNTAMGDAQSALASCISDLNPP